MLVLVRTLLLLLIVSCNSAYGAGVTPPVRQGVDVYNAVGSNQRLIGFMKIGADKKDLRYLGFLSARTGNKPLPRAFLAGNLIYFKGLDQPLKVIDLKQKIFSFNGKRIDLRGNSTIEVRMAQLEKIVFPRRSAFILWDWIFPYAFAGTENPAQLAVLSGVLAVGGLTSSAQCLNERQDLNCTQHFMGPLAAIGAVGGLRANDPANKVFCSPDFHGGQKFVISGEDRNLLAVSQSHGEYDISPSHLQEGSVASNNAAGELIETCKSPGALANMNIALAYPARVTATGAPATQIAARTQRPAHQPTATATRSPAAVSEATIYQEQGGTAR